jgi:hypothetical protein
MRANGLLATSILVSNSPKTAKISGAKKFRFRILQRLLLLLGVLIPPRHNHFDRKNSFFIEGANRWNSLPSEVQSARSVETFKETYYAHTPMSTQQ